MSINKFNQADYYVAYLSRSSMNSNDDIENLVSLIRKAKFLDILEQVGIQSSTSYTNAKIGFRETYKEEY